MDRQIKNIIYSPLAKRIFTYGISDSLSKVAPFIVIPIILKFLTPEDYGYITNFQAIANMFIPLVLLNGHTYYSVRFHKIEAQNQDTYYWNIIYVNIVLALLLLIGTYFTKDLLHNYYELKSEWIYLAILYAFFQSMVMLFQTLQRMNEDVKNFARIKIGNSIVSALLSLLFVTVLGYAWQGRIFALLLTSISTAFIGVLLFRKFKIADFILNPKIIKGFLIFSLPLLPHSVAGWSRGAIEKGMITSITSIEENGILAVAGVPMMMITLVSSAIFSAFNPEILKYLSRIQKEDISKSYIHQLKIVKLSYIALSIVTAIIILTYPVSWLFFKFYLDASYIDGLKYVPFLLLGTFFGIFYTLFSLYIMNEEKTIILTYITVTTVSIQLVANYFALKTWGVIGLVKVNATFSLIQSAIVFFYANNLRPMPWTYFLKK